MAIPLRCFGYTGEHAMIVALEEIIMIDDSVREIADIPEGTFVERKSRNDTWQPYHEIPS